MSIDHPRSTPPHGWLMTPCSRQAFGKDLLSGGGEDWFLHRNGPNARGMNRCCLGQQLPGSCEISQIDPFLQCCFAIWLHASSLHQRMHQALDLIMHRLDIVGLGIWWGSARKWTTLVRYLTAFRARTKPLSSPSGNVSVNNESFHGVRVCTGTRIPES